MPSPTNSTSSTNSAFVTNLTCWLSTSVSTTLLPLSFASDLTLFIPPHSCNSVNNLWSQTLCQISSALRNKHQFHRETANANQSIISHKPKSRKFRISNVKSICLPCCCLMKLRPMNHLLEYFSLQIHKAQVTGSSYKKLNANTIIMPHP